MPTVDCKLTDCAKHGRDICIARRIGIDGVGQVECYDPVPRSAVVHTDALRYDLERGNRRWKNRIKGILK